MILHTSIPAANSAQVSAVLAEIIGEEGFGLRPSERSFVALAKEETGLSLEAHPDDLSLRPDAFRQESGAAP